MYKPTGTLISILENTKSTAILIDLKAFIATQV